MRLLTALAGTLILAAPAAHARIIVVDLSGGGDFTHIQPALGAAVNGDTVLVRQGDYGYLDIIAAVSGKGITLVADGPRTVIDPIVIEDIPAGQRGVVRGFGLSRSLFPGLPGILVLNCAGAVWLEDLSAIGGDGSGSWLGSEPGGPAAAVESSALVIMTRGDLRGGRGIDEYVGGPVGSYPPSAGGAGLVSTDSRVSLDGCVTHGGETLGDGGNGLVIDPSSSVEALDSIYAGGAGGSQGQSGVDLVDPAGDLTAYAGQARWMTFPTPVREEEKVTLTLEGLQGDTAMLFRSPWAQQLPFPQGKARAEIASRFGIPSSGHIGPLLNRRILGTCSTMPAVLLTRSRPTLTQIRAPTPWTYSAADPEGRILPGFPMNGPVLTARIVSLSGRRDIPIMIPDLPSPGMESIAVQRQAFFVNTGEMTIGSATGPVVLDVSFLSRSNRDRR